MQRNQRLVIGQDAVTVQVLDGDGQLYSRLTVVGLAQHALDTNGEGNGNVLGGLIGSDLLHRLFGGLLVSRLGLIRGFRFLRGFRGFLCGSLRLFLRGGFRFFLGSLCLDCGILDFHCGNRVLRARRVSENAGRHHTDQHYDDQQQGQHTSFHSILPFFRKVSGKFIATALHR